MRTDVPFRDLTDREKDIVFHGPAEKKHIFYHNKNSNQAGELDFTYFNATYTVENALSKVKDEKGMKRVEKFLRQGICPDCGGTRLCNAARTPKLRGITLDKACQMTLVPAYRLGGGCAGQSAGRDAAHGPQYLRILPDGSGTAALAGPWLPDAGPLRFHSFHR